MTSDELLLRMYLEGAARAREAAQREVRTDNPHRVAVVRLTTPGAEDAATLVEWQGVAYVRADPQWEYQAPLHTGIITDYGTPRMVGLVWDLDLSSTEVTSPHAVTFSLEDRVGLELWSPMGVELDPLDPRYNWDTAAGEWIKARYLHAYVRAAARWGGELELEVTVIQSGPVMYTVEVIGDAGQ